MAEEITVARPYAEAVFRLALETNALQGWSDMLGFAAAVAQDPQMSVVLGNPKLTAQQRETTLLAVSEGKLNAEAQNFLRVLLENGRITLLPQIHELFERLKADHEGVVDALITSALPLEQAQLGDLVKNLETKFKRKVNAKVDVDPELIGGATIVVGDEVIDLSVRGQLQHMAFALKR